MAAILAGTMRVPLTAVVFAFGLTHDVNAFLPTILACAVSYGFSVIVMPRSILTEKIARRGRHVFREYGVDPLERHFVDEVMTRAVITIPASLSARDALRDYFGVNQAHRAYPVVQGQHLLTMLDRSVLAGLSPQVLEQPLSASLAGRESAAFATPADTCRSIALRLAALGLERLPVVDDPLLRNVLGIVSRSDLVKPARALHDEDVRRERGTGT
jgi:CBS domain-containing protein